MQIIWPDIQMMEDITKNIIFTNALGANVQPIQYQTADGTILKQPKIEGQKEQPTFYYTTTNVSVCLRYKHF